MDFVINKSFIQDFFISYDEKNEIHRDFLNYIKNIPTSTNLIFDVESTDELQELTLDNPIWEFFYDKITEEPLFIHDLETHIGTIEFYKKYSYPIKIFLTNLNDEKCSQLPYKFGYEYININNLEKIWSKYASNKKYNLPISKNTEINTFNSWDKLEKYIHPLHSMIIFDKYLFTEYAQKNGNYEKQFSMDDNLLTLLSKLIVNKKNTMPLHILIITDFKTISIDEYITNGNTKECLDYINEKIYSFIIDKFPKVYFQLSLVNYNHRVSDAERIHDRFVVTNNMFFQFGAGINIFSISKQVINISMLNCLIMISKDKSTILLHLNNLARYIADLKNYLKVHRTLYSKYFIGDISHRLLTNL